MKIKLRSDNLLVTFMLKSIICTAIFSLIFCAIFSYIILKFDLSYTFYDVLAGTAVFLISFLTSLISTSSMKNNVFAMSLISNSILIIATAVNGIFENNIILCVIEIAIIIISSFISSQLVLKKHRGFSV